MKLSNKKKMIIIGIIILTIISINIGYNQYETYKYKTGSGLTNTEKAQNIKIEILGERYDKALKLCDNYYENNDNIRMQWKTKIEKCKSEGINKFMMHDSLDDIK